MISVSWNILITICVIFMISNVDARCKKTENGKKYKLTIALLTDDQSNVTLQEEILVKNVLLAGEVENCFLAPHYVKLRIHDDLQLRKRGWKWIENGIKLALVSQGGTRPNLIIGPFYTNLAMILEREGIPYLVTDYKGFDWIDMSRVEDRVDWRTIVEIRPPAQEQNKAVVDIFVTKQWKSAVLVMPESDEDNQECQDLSTQLLSEEVSIIPYTVNVQSPESNQTIVEILRSSQISRQRRIIICSPRDPRDHLIRKILEKARPFNLLSNKRQNFIFVDPSSYLEPFAGARQMYQLGLFSARCFLYAFRYIEPSDDRSSQDANSATSLDAAKITTMALNYYISTQTVLTNDFSDERFLVAMKKVNIPFGETGMIRFNSTGQRIDYQLDLYTHGGEKMYKKVLGYVTDGFNVSLSHHGQNEEATHRLLERLLWIDIKTLNSELLVADWTPSSKTPNTRMEWKRSNRVIQRTAEFGIFPDLVKVVVVLEDPFVMRKAGSLVLNGHEEYEGFTVDLLHILADTLNFEYEIYISPKNQYGARHHGGVWDGMVGEIISGNATLAMGAISITSQRETAIDFSLGVLTTGVNILVQMPEDHYTIFQFLKPFSLELWMAILGSSVVVCLVYFILDYTHPFRKFTMKETLWFSIGTLLKRGTDFSPGPISQRILTIGFGFFVLITVATYTANMAAFLTTKNLGKTVDSFESLSLNDDIECGSVRNSATLNFLRMGTKPVFKRLYAKIEESDGMVANSSVGRKRVAEGNFAFIFDYLINSYAEGHNCNITAVASPILIQEHGIGMAAGAPFKTSVNIELLNLKERGTLQGLKKKWWDDRRKCDADSLSNKKKPQVQFGVRHTAGVFILGAFGTACGVAFFLFKKFYLLAKPVKKNGSEESKSEKEKLKNEIYSNDLKIYQNNLDFPPPQNV